MTDVEDLVRDTLDHYARTTELSADVLERMAAKRSRRTMLVRAGGYVAAAAAVVALVVAGVAINRPMNAVIEPAADGAGQATSTEPSGDTADAGGSGWEGLTVDQAIERLVAANRDAADRPVPGDGEVLVDRRYAIWAGEVRPPEGVSVAYELFLYVIEYEHQPDGTVHKRKIEVDSREPTDDPDELRAWAKQALNAEGVEERLRESAPTEVDLPSDASKALDEAESDSFGSNDPVVVEVGPGETSTELPEQVSALIRAEDALRHGLAPDDRIRALEAIGRLDDSLVEYHGPVVDLLGREGVGIAGLHHGAKNVLIFDKTTGELLGQYNFASGPQASPDIPGINTYTVHETFIRQAE